MPKPSPICSIDLIDRTPTCDRQTDRHGAIASSRVCVGSIARVWMFGVVVCSE